MEAILHHFVCYGGFCLAEIDYLYVGGQEKEWMGCFLDDLRAFGINADQCGRLQPSTMGNGAGRQNKGKNVSRQNGSHAVVCPNVTGRTEERIAQSKRARAGSLAIVD